MAEPLPPELEEMRQGLTGGDRAVFDANAEYILRLRRILRNRAERNLLSREVATRIAISYENFLTGTGFGPFRKFTPIPLDAPFFKQIVGVSDLEFEEVRIKEATALKVQQETQIRETAKRESAQRTTLPILSDYFSNAVKRGDINEEQKQVALLYAQQQLGVGVPPQNLPNFLSAQRFAQAGGTEGIAERKKLAEAFRKNEAGALRIQAEQFQRERDRFQGVQSFVVEQQRAAALGGLFKRPRLSRFQKRGLFEGAREEALSGLGGQFDWIRRWQAEHTLNPFLEEEEEEERERRRFRLTGSRELQALPTTPLWLRKLVPELQRDQPISKDVDIPIPSFERFRELLPSQRQQYAGFLQFAGKYPEDIFAQIERGREPFFAAKAAREEAERKRVLGMRPRTPAGAGRFGFAPIRQRTGRF